MQLTKPTPPRFFIQFIWSKDLKKKPFSFVIYNSSFEEVHSLIKELSSKNEALMQQKTINKEKYHTAKIVVREYSGRKWGQSKTWSIQEL